MKPMLAERIAKMLADLQITQTELALLAGVTKGTVNQWVSGITKEITAAAVLSLQKKTGYSAEWIVSGEGPVKIAYMVDQQALIALACMEKMDKQAREQFIKIGITLAESDGKAGQA